RPSGGSLARPSGRCRRSRRTRLPCSRSPGDGILFSAGGAVRRYWKVRLAPAAAFAGTRVTCYARAQVPPDSATDIGSRRPIWSTQEPAATHDPAPEQATESRKASGDFVAESLGSMSCVAWCQVPPDSVAANALERSVLSAYTPTATHDPSPGHARAVSMTR